MWVWTTNRPTRIGLCCRCRGRGVSFSVRCRKWTNVWILEWLLGKFELLHLCCIFHLERWSVEDFTGVQRHRRLPLLRCQLFGSAVPVTVDHCKSLRWRIILLQIFRCCSLCHKPPLVVDTPISRVIRTPVSPSTSTTLRRRSFASRIRAWVLKWLLTVLLLF